MGTANYTYPGVYIQEVPSGVHPITGATTSVTAFIGRALMGPVDTPTQVNGFGDFQRIFGGLWYDSPMTYSVQQFYNNGGATGIIVRIVAADAATALIDMPTEAQTTGAATTATIDSTGGEITANLSYAGEPANVKLSIPSNALSASTQLSLGPQSTSIVEQYYAAVGAAATLSPGGTAFAQEVTLTMPFLPQLLPRGPSLPPEFGSNYQQVAAVIEKVLGAVWRVVNVLQIKLLVADADDNVAVVDQKFYGKLKALLQQIDQQLQQKSVDEVAAGALGDQLKEIAADLPRNQQAIFAVSAFATAQPAVYAKSKKVTAPATGSTIELQAKSPGSWANNLQATVDYNTRDPSDPTLFNLTVQLLDPATGAVTGTENYLNLSITPGTSTFAPEVLLFRSAYVEIPKSVALNMVARPAANTYTPTTFGADGGIPSTTDYQNGIAALTKAGVVNILSIPPLARYGDPNVANPDIPAPVWTAAESYCDQCGAILVVDPPENWSSVSKAQSGMTKNPPGGRNNNSAIYWPLLIAPDSLMNNRPARFAPSGAMAGIMARTDAQRGVWKAPAGQQANIAGILGLSVHMTDAENGELNPLGLNCLRRFPIIGPVVWGARTSEGADQLSSQWKYLSVRRTALYIEQSLYLGMQWAVFEPNDETLWSQITSNITAFMQNMFVAGAFQGSMPQDAYFVQCDAATNPQSNIDQGIVTANVGFAPVYPAEFVVITLQQMAGQSPS